MWTFMMLVIHLGRCVNQPSIDTSMEVPLQLLVAASLFERERDWLTSTAPGTPLPIHRDRCQPRHEQTDPVDLACREIGP